MNIKEFLTINIKKNENILKLTTDKKIYFLHALSPKVPYIEYEIIDEYGSYYDENKRKYTKYLIQIDIFSNEDYTDLEEAIKKELEEKGFEYMGGADLYEAPPINLYHKGMRFEIDLQEI